MVDAAQGLFAADERRDVVHAGTFARAYERQPQRVHHLSHAVSLLFDPAVDDLFGVLFREVVDRGQYAAQLAQDFGVLAFPVLPGLLLLLFGRRREEERREVPEVGDERGALLHDADRKSTRLNSSHYQQSRMPSSA